MFISRLMLLGSGELGREFAIAAKRLGCEVVACDRYPRAPAMQVADHEEVFSMLDGGALRAAVERYRPDFIVPEVEAIDTATLVALEAEGWKVVPSARATELTMNRDGIRRFAAEELGLVTSRYRFAESEEEAVAAAEEVGLPCVVKPVMSSSGKGQSTAATFEEVRSAFAYAIEKMRGDRPRVIVEEFIRFDSEITLLTVSAADGIHFCAPIGHRQEAGDYRESWQPAAIAPDELASAQQQAARIVGALGGFGLFGVEFFIAGNRAIFSELSPRPHDTGMVTLIGQEPNEFELHLRAILGLPVAPIVQRGPAASAIILASRASSSFAFRGVAGALGRGSSETPVDLRLFGKPETLPGRRMGVALARAGSVEAAVALATEVAGAVHVVDQEEER
jgi:phosphoribosylglycinamide formyltransferase 2